MYGVNINYDLYYDLFHANIEQQRLAEEVEKQMMQEGLGKKNKNTFF